MDSIIFDLDGTLWDSRKEVCIAWNEVLTDLNIDKKVTIEDMTSTMGMLLYDIGKKLFPDLDDESMNKIIIECCHRENKYLSKHGAELYDNLELVLEKLSKKYKLFIVSNCNDGYIESFFESHKLDKYFIDTECPGRTGLNKAENIKLIIKRNNLKSPIYVGDTQGDCNSSMAAGIPFVHARYGYGKDVEPYDHVVDNIEELLELF
jgi:phosphoglycolate phosphatase